MATSVQPKDKTVNVNGINLHYLDWGAEGKPTVLLLHGLRGHCHSWDDVSAEFCRDYHVLALDQRGRGESDWAPGGDYSSQSFVADLEGFCQAVGPSDPATAAPSRPSASTAVHGQLRVRASSPRLWRLRGPCRSPSPRG